MFDAIILVCAATIADGPQLPCITLSYSQGPLTTLESCEKALEEMKKDMDEDWIFQYYLWDSLGNPELVARNMSCTENNDLSA